MSGRFIELLRCLDATGVRFAVIGVSGANYYATTTRTLFSTLDRDLFLPPEPENLLAAWLCCRDNGLELGAGGEPLEEPLDLELATRVVDRLGQVSATATDGLHVDLTLTMAGFSFDRVWSDRRVFIVDDVEVPVARLAHIVASKERLGRAKDRLFLEAHREALEELLSGDQE